LLPLFAMLSQFLFESNKVFYLKILCFWIINIGC